MSPSRQDQNAPQDDPIAAAKEVTNQPSEKGDFASVSSDASVSVGLERAGVSTPGGGPVIATTPPAPDPSARQTVSSSSFGLPQIADDTDLIEKEWVDKAKEIVEQTAHDPHLQNQEINKVKMDYLKKRYNKDVKLNE